MLDKTELSNKIKIMHDNPDLVSDYEQDFEKFIDEITGNFNKDPKSFSNDFDLNCKLLKAIIHTSESDNLLKNTFDFLHLASQPDEKGKTIAATVLFDCLQFRAENLWNLKNKPPAELPNDQFLEKSDETNEKLFAHLADFLLKTEKSDPKRAVKYFFNASASYLNESFSDHYNKNIKNFLDKIGNIIDKVNLPGNEIPKTMLEEFNYNVMPVIIKNIGIPGV